MFRKESWSLESKIGNLYGLETNYHRTPEIDPNLVRYPEIYTMDRKNNMFALSVKVSNATLKYLKNFRRTKEGP